MILKVGEVMNKRRLVCFALILTGMLMFSFVDAYAISWKSNLEIAQRQAEIKRKPVLVDFYTDWCGWCKKMDRDTYSDAKVKKLALEFICVKINADKHSDLVKKYNIRGYPQTIFFDSSGKVIKRVSGYQGPTDFVKSMEEALGKQKPPPKEAKKKRKKKRKYIWSKASFELTGIIYDPKKPLAVINGSLIGVGEMVDGAEVIEIKKRNVIIRYRNKEIVLNIK